MLKKPRVIQILFVLRPILLVLLISFLILSVEILLLILVGSIGSWRIDWLPPAVGAT